MRTPWWDIAIRLGLIALLSGVGFWQARKGFNAITLLNPELGKAISSLIGGYWLLTLALHYLGEWKVEKRL